MAWQAFFQDVDAKLAALVRPIGERFGITAEVVAAECERMIAETNAL